FVGRDTEAGTVGDAGRLGDAANRNIGFSLCRVWIPDRPRIDLALRERAQRVGGLEKDQRDVGGAEPAAVQLREHVAVRRAALADRDPLTSQIGYGANRRVGVNEDFVP